VRPAPKSENGKSKRENPKAKSDGYSAGSEVRFSVFDFQVSHPPFPGFRLITGKNRQKEGINMEIFTGTYIGAPSPFDTTYSINLEVIALRSLANPVRKPQN
jgi:hypothetical protein